MVIPKGSLVAIEMKDYAGVDYYTATTDVGSVGMNWFSLWNKHKEQAIKNGSKVHSMRKWGYNCVFVRGLTWGRSDNNSYMMISSSSVAGLTWSKILPTARRITRLDLQYTFASPEPINLNQIYKRWLTGKNGKRKASMINNSLGGETLYLGSRNSDQFGRFYNKSAEASLETKNIYRLEVELKKPRSGMVFKQLYEAMGRCNLRATDVRDYVLSWFDDRGVLTGVDFEKVKPIQLAKSVSSDDKKLIWLKTSVAPSLSDLMQRSKGADVAMALGLKSEDYQQLALFAADVQFEKIDTVKGLTGLAEEIKNKSLEYDIS